MNWSQVKRDLIQIFCKTDIVIRVLSLIFVRLSWLGLGITMFLFLIYRSAFSLGFTQYVAHATIPPNILKFR